ERHGRRVPERRSSTLIQAAQAIRFVDNELFDLGRRELLEHELAVADMNVVLYARRATVKQSPGHGRRASVASASAWARRHPAPYAAPAPPPGPSGARTCASRPVDVQPPREPAAYARRRPRPSAC